MKKIFVFGALAGLLFVGGCDVTTPSRVNMTHVRVQEIYKTETFRLAKVDQGKMDDLVRFYKKDGSGPVRIVATYMEESLKSGGSALAEGKKIQKMLQDRGVTNTLVDTVGVKDTGQSGQAVISFKALKALPPAQCGSITGKDGGETLAEDDAYMLGCESQTALSQMIANPEDLLGRDGTGKGDARRQGGVTEPYKQGTPNELFYGAAAASAIGSQ